MIDRDDPRLTAYVLGELEPDQIVEVEAAVAQSPELQGWVAELRETVDLLKCSYAEELRTEHLRTMESGQRLGAGSDSVNAVPRAVDAGTVQRQESPLDGAINRVSVGRAWTGAGRAWVPWAAATALIAILLGLGSWLMGPGEVDVRMAEDLPQLLREELALQEEQEELAVQGERLAELSADGLIREQESRVGSQPSSAAGPVDRDLDGRMSGRLQGPEDSENVVDNFIRDDSDVPDTATRRGENERFSSGDHEDLLQLLDGTVDPLSWYEITLARRKYAPDGMSGMDGQGGMRGGSDRFDRIVPQYGGYIEEGPFEEGREGETSLGLHMLPQYSEGLDALAADAEVVDSFFSAFGFNGQVPGQVPGQAQGQAQGQREGQDEGSVQGFGGGRPDRPMGMAGETSLSRAEVEQENSRLASGRFKADVADQPQRGLNRAKAEPAPVPQPQRTWRRVAATPNASRLLVGDRDELPLSATQVQVQIDGFRARVIMDMFYYNDRDRQLEGNFKLRLPDDASLFYLAFGDSVHEFTKPGQTDPKQWAQAMQTQYVSLRPEDISESRGENWKNVKEARMVTREKAALAYGETVRRQVDPALAEWSGGGVFNARVFPLMPRRMHRIVVGYDVNLTRVGDTWQYRLDLPERSDYTRVEMGIDEQADEDLAVEPVCQAVRRDGRVLYVWENPADAVIELRRAGGQPLWLVDPAADQLGYFATQVVPDLPAESAGSSSRALFLLDTSLSANPDQFNVWLQLLERTLQENRDQITSFAVLFFSVDQYFWRDEYSVNSPENVQALLADCQNLVLEGATNLYDAAGCVGDAQWVTADGPRPDWFLLSDGTATWGETALPLIRAEFERAGPASLFAYQTGLPGASMGNLRGLTAAFGGAVFSVADESEIVGVATAHRQRPWRVLDLQIDGAVDVLSSGRVEWLYPGQALTIVGRGRPTGPIRLSVQQGEEQRELVIDGQVNLESEMPGRLYGQVAVGQLENLGTIVSDASAAYARHYRVTGETCSLVMLESEEDYRRFDIKPEEDLFLIKTQPAGRLVAETLAAGAAQLADPRSRLEQWLSRLESLPGLQFKSPAALRLILPRIDVEPLNTRLETRQRTVQGLSEDYLLALRDEPLDYQQIMEEVQRRRGESVEDAVKALSNLIEREAGDLELSRDVAWSVMELDRPEHAFGLLKRVALARPYEGSIYLTMADCLAQAGRADLAVVYYEVALNGQFPRVGADFRRIVAVAYGRLLGRMVRGEVSTQIADYAAARLETLQRDYAVEDLDLVVTLMWNTDRTDIDLYVTEPSGDVCSYQQRKTRIGGRISADITTGFGPEMYWLTDAPGGSYQIDVKYHSSDQNRSRAPSRVLVTVVQSPGTKQESVQQKVVGLADRGELQSVMTIEIDKATK